METFILVICILMTFGSIVALAQGFEEQVSTTKERFITFLFAVGLSIWGWILYF